MIRGFDVLHNFISPVTGRILATENYVLVGNASGIAVPAPDLIDLRLDLINLRVDFDVASSASYITGFTNSRLPNAQVLYSLPDGFIFNTAGVVSTSIVIPIESLPDLTENNIWIGDETNRPTPNLTIAIENLPELTKNNIWVGDGTNRPVESSNFIKGPIASVPSTIVLWDGISGRFIKNSGFFISELEALAEEATIAAEEATAAAAEASAAAAEASAAAVEASLAALAAAASAAVALVGGGKGRRGDAGRTGSIGASGAIGDTGLIGATGAAGASGKTTTVIDSNINITGGRIQDLAPSPSADFDAVTAKWVWDLLNDNVEIKWE